jgi:hypothetical protein
VGFRQSSAGKGGENNGGTATFVFGQGHASCETQPCPFILSHRLVIHHDGTLGDAAHRMRVPFSITLETSSFSDQAAVAAVQSAWIEGIIDLAAAHESTVPSLDTRAMAAIAAAGARPIIES